MSVGPYNTLKEVSIDFAIGTKKTCEAVGGFIKGTFDIGQYVVKGSIDLATHATIQSWTMVRYGAPTVCVGLLVYDFYLRTRENDGRATIALTDMANDVVANVHYKTIAKAGLIKASATFSSALVDLPALARGLRR
jgi:hypothetical protein